MFFITCHQRSKDFYYKYLISSPQTDRNSRENMCNYYRFTFVHYLTKAHLHILKALTSFPVPAQHRRLILADYIQQHNVGRGKERTQYGTRTSFFTIRLMSSIHCLSSETAHRHRVRRFKPKSFSYFSDHYQQCILKKGAVSFCYNRCSNGSIVLQSVVQQSRNRGRICN